MRISILTKPVLTFLSVNLVPTAIVGYISLQEAFERRRRPQGSTERFKGVNYRPAMSAPVVSATYEGIYTLMYTDQPLNGRRPNRETNSRSYLGHNSPEEYRRF